MSSILRSSFAKRYTESNTGFWRARVLKIGTTDSCGWRNLLCCASGDDVLVVKTRQFHQVLDVGPVMVTSGSSSVERDSERALDETRETLAKFRLDFQSTGGER